MNTINFNPMLSAINFSTIKNEVARWLNHAVTYIQQSQHSLAATLIAVNGTLLLLSNRVSNLVERLFSEQKNAQPYIKLLAFSSVVIAANMFFDRLTHLQLNRYILAANIIGTIGAHVLLQRYYQSNEIAEDETVDSPTQESIDSPKNQKVETEQKDDPVADLKKFKKERLEKEQAKAAKEKLEKEQAKAEKEKLEKEQAKAAKERLEKEQAKAEQEKLEKEQARANAIKEKQEKEQAKAEKEHAKTQAVQLKKEKEKEKEKEKIEKDLATQASDDSTNQDLGIDLTFDDPTKKDVKPIAVQKQQEVEQEEQDVEQGQPKATGTLPLTDSEKKEEVESDDKDDLYTQEEHNKQEEDNKIDNSEQKGKDPAELANKTLTDLDLFGSVNLGNVDNVLDLFTTKPKK